MAYIISFSYTLPRYTILQGFRGAQRSYGGQRCGGGGRERTVVGVKNAWWWGKKRATGMLTVRDRFLRGRKEIVIYGE